MPHARADRPDWIKLASAANYNARELAKLSDFSQRQLERVIQRAFGQPPQQWLNHERLKAAQRLLLAGQSVKRVAYELGYKQSSHFCRQFKARNNLTPSEFIHAALAGPPKCRSQITDVAQG